MSYLEREVALSFLERVAHRRAAKVVSVVPGIFVSHSDYGVTYDHNRLIVTRACEAVDAMEEAGRLGVEYDLRHRNITFHYRVLSIDVGKLIEEGYRESRDVMMAYAGQGTRLRASEFEIERLSLEDRVACGIEAWHGYQPTWDDESIRQLGSRPRTLIGAVDTEFFGVRNDAGSIVGRIELYHERGVAQIEGAWTKQDYRRRGIMSSLLAHALEVARSRGARLTFLLANSKDWPREAYARAGFRSIGEISSFSKRC